MQISLMLGSLFTAPPVRESKPIPSRGGVSADLQVNEWFDGLTLHSSTEEWLSSGSSNYGRDKYVDGYHRTSDGTKKIIWEKEDKAAACLGRKTVSDGLYPCEQVSRSLRRLTASKGDEALTGGVVVALRTVRTISPDFNPAPASLASPNARSCRYTCRMWQATCLLARLHRLLCWVERYAEAVHTTKYPSV